MMQKMKVVQDIRTAAGALREVQHPSPGSAVCRTEVSMFGANVM